MTVAAPPIQVPPLTGPARTSEPAPSDNRLVLYGVSWEEYEKFLDAVGTHRIRLTYDRGTLEIMTVSNPHEWWKVRFGLAVTVLGAVLKLKVQGYGSSTQRREDVGRGLEPDQCFYIRNADRVYGPRTIDLTRDPPPDLAVEIDVSRSSLDRLGICAALGIPEVWRFDEEVLHVHVLRPDATYEERQQSVSFPALPIPEFVAFLRHTQNLSDAEFLGACQEWVRQHVLPRVQQPSGGPLQ